MQDNPSISPNDLFRFVLRGLPLALVVAVIAAVVAYQLSQNESPRFETRATLFASQSRQSQDPLGRTLYTPPAVDVSVYQIAAKSEPVLREALVALGTLEADITQTDVLRLRNSVSVYPVETDLSSLVHIDALGRTPEQATEMANAVARALVSWDNRRAHRQLCTHHRLFRGTSSGPGQPDQVAPGCRRGDAGAGRRLFTPASRAPRTVGLRAGPGGFGPESARALRVRHAPALAGLAPPPLRSHGGFRPRHSPGLWSTVLAAGA